MSFHDKSISTELKILIAATLILPVWILVDSSLSFVGRLSCEIPNLVRLCSLYQPEREAILASLSIFHLGAVVGYLLVAYLLNRNRPVLSLLINAVVLGLFIDFFLEYQLMVGEVFCGRNCGGSITFLSLFLERYDKFFLAFFPIHSCWLLKLIIQQQLRKRRTLR